MGKKDKKSNAPEGDQMTRLEEIKERCEQATPGPLKLQSVFEHKNDAALIAHSRCDVPWLISQLEKAIKVIKFYSDPKCAQLKQDVEFQTFREKPFGHMAREFLKELNG